MTEKPRHPARSVMFSQAIGCENNWKSRITWRREPIFLAGEPVDHGICIARVKRVVHRRLERFVVRRYRPVLQTFRNMQPAESVFVQDEWRIAGNSIHSILVSGWAKLGRFIDHKIWHVDAIPFALPLVPPDQFLALAPRLASRFGARSIIYNAAIRRPGEAPAVAKVIFRIARVRLVDFVRAKDTRINPAAAR